MNSYWAWMYCLMSLYSFSISTFRMFYTWVRFWLYVVWCVISFPELTPPSILGVCVQCVFRNNSSTSLCDTWCICIVLIMSKWCDMWITDSFASIGKFNVEFLRIIENAWNECLSIDGICDGCLTISKDSYWDDTYLWMSSIESSECLMISTRRLMRIKRMQAIISNSSIILEKVKKLTRSFLSKKSA